MCKWNVQCVSFGDCLISASMMSSRFTYIVACASTPFLFKAVEHSAACIYRILFIHSSIVGHGLFPRFGYCECAAVSIGVRASPSGPVSNSFGNILKSRIAESHGAFIFNCLRACHPVIHSVSHTFKLPSQVPWILRAVTQDFKAARFFLFFCSCSKICCASNTSEVLGLPPILACAMTDFPWAGSVRALGSISCYRQRCP